LFTTGLAWALSIEHRWARLQVTEPMDKVNETATSWELLIESGLFIVVFLLVSLALCLLNFSGSNYGSSIAGLRLYFDDSLPKVSERRF